MEHEGRSHSVQESLSPVLKAFIKNILLLLFRIYCLKFRSPISKFKHELVFVIYSFIRTFFVSCHVRAPLGPPCLLSTRLPGGGRHSWLHPRGTARGLNGAAFKWTGVIRTVCLWSILFKAASKLQLSSELLQLLIPAGYVSTPEFEPQLPVSAPVSAPVRSPERA